MRLDLESLMPTASAAAIVIALGLDFAVRELPDALHPVAWYGSVLEPLDRAWNRPRLVGSVAAVGFPLLAGGVAVLVTAAAFRQHPAIGTAVAGLVLFSTTSLRMLLEVAGDVVNDSGSDLAAARDRLPSLVGRDPAELSAGEIRSAAVESVAENLADGFLAPLAAFVLLAWSPPLAAGGAAWVKAVNTGDSMFGYRSKPVGWAFARLDDAVMWLPARLTALVIATAAAQPGAIPTARQWAAEPTSPNAGWPMATLAVALDVRLEKPGAYVLNPTGGLPSIDDANHGLRICRRAGVLAGVIAGVIAWP